MKPQSPAGTAEWRALAAHAEASLELRRLFDEEPDRVDRLTVDAGDLRIDYSKNLVDAPAMELLLELAQRVGVTRQRDALFAGEHVNTSEDRPALHPALRMPADASLSVGSRNVVAEVHDVLAEMSEFATAVLRGEWTGHGGQRIRTVLNLGIGGSALGPRMACRALSAFRPAGLDVRFAANVDPAALLDAMAGAEPGATLVIVASKSFGTPETLANAHAARRWLAAAFGGDDEAAKRQVVAVTANPAAAEDFGVHRVFRLWDWVGGRYSVDSAIGLSLMLAVGPDRFREFLGGFHRMDEHFRTEPPARNAPILAALLDIWNRNFLQLQTHAVIPYSQRLADLPAYLQQLVMESNGKRVRRDGTAVNYDTAPTVWGQPGTNGQHAFFQMLHQGTTVVPTDLIGFLRPQRDVDGHHDTLMANLFAQSAALAFGRTAAEVAAADVPPELVPHRTFPGNRPTTVILAPALTPAVLGQLIAFYEHRTFVQGAVWGIDSFDQWGVELGKELAGSIEPQLGAEHPRLDHDPSTNALIRRYRAAAARETEREDHADD